MVCLQLPNFIPPIAQQTLQQVLQILYKIYPVLEKVQQINMPLLIHGEVTDSDIDIFDREKIFIDTVLSKVRQ